MVVIGGSNSLNVSKQGATVIPMKVMAIVLAACASTVHAQSVAGKWLGLRSSQAGVSCWIADRSEDGRYRTEFLIREGAETRRHVEEGRWLSSNGMYATITESMNGAKTDPRDKYYREFYVIEKLSENEFSYREIASGQRFTVQRVGQASVLGSNCPAGS
jgi:hypothetical protein